jgi:hypothetical protein
VTDGPIASIALGTLAVSRGVSDTAALAVAVCNPSGTRVNTADLHALIVENQQLHAQNMALRADIAALESYASKLEAWGETMKARADAQSG